MGKSRRTGKLLSPRPTIEEVSEDDQGPHHPADGQDADSHAHGLAGQRGQRNGAWLGGLLPLTATAARRLARVRWHLEERMRTHLRKRHKVRDRKTGIHPVYRTEICTLSTGSTKCRRQQAGRGRMPRGEGHRKAVCGKTACTV
ncbi:MAG: hypothetical protein MZV70_61080 [Desulfobacterales bacterium]|nr:hypothetical protein [Desulfobacterales bacterium]